MLSRPERLALALRQAALGFHVFPLRATDDVRDGKTPRERLPWRSVATTDPETIVAWWGPLSGGDYGVGVATGESGLIVVDVDISGDRNGYLALAGLSLPPTYSVTTPSGGLHLYFRGDPLRRVGNSKSSDPRGPLAGTGIDIRAVGGYVCAPGTELSNGRYVSTTRDVSDAPAHFVELLLAGVQPEPGILATVDRPARDVPSGYVASALAGAVRDYEQAERGSGERLLFSGLCRGFELANSEWAGLDVEAWLYAFDQARLRRLNAIGAAGHGQSDLDWRRVVNSAYRKVGDSVAATPAARREFRVNGVALNAETPGSSSAQRQLTGGSVPATAVPDSEVSVSRLDARTPATQQGDGPSTEGLTGSGGSPAAGLSLSGASVSRLDTEILTTRAQRENEEPPRWLIPGWLPERATGALVASSQSFKSFVGLHAALTIATGGLWAGKRVRAAPVLYVAAEDGYRMNERIDAWEAAHRVEVADGMFCLLRRAVQARSNEWDDLVRKAQQLGVVAVFVDTRQKSTNGYKENEADDMGEYMDQLERFRDELGITGMDVHHLGRAGPQSGGRGSGVPYDRADFEWQIERPDRKGDGARLFLTKMRGSRDDLSLAVSVKVVALSAYPDGEPRESRAVSEAERPESIEVSELLRRGPVVERAVRIVAVLNSGQFPLKEAHSRAKIMRALGVVGGSSREAKNSKALWNQAFTYLIELGILAETGGSAQFPIYVFIPASEREKVHEIDDADIDDDEAS